jgi:hypothetical protein
MLSLFEQLQVHIENEIRKLIGINLNTLRELEYIRNSEAKRAFISGKLESYEEILEILERYRK